RGFDEEAYLDAIRHCGVALYEQGRLAEAEPLFRRALEEARRRALPSVEVRTSGYLVRAVLLAGRPAEGLELLEASEATWSRLHTSAYVRVHSQLPRMRAEIQVVSGPWEDALADLQELAGAAPEPHVRLQILRRLVELGARAGGAERADEV